MTGRSVCIGFDIGGTRLRAIAEDAADRTRSDVADEPVPRSVPELLARVAELAEAVAAGARIESIAIGLPGQVSATTCTWIPNLRFLDGVALADEVTDRLGAPCELINDAQATLTAEAAEGAARGRADVALLAVGTGIGGAFQVGGRIVRGARGCAGSFGWLPFPGGAPDPDHGQWELAGAGARLDELAAEWGSAAGLVEAVRAGDPGARATFDGYAAVLGQGAAGLASVLDPELIVFAGGLVTAFDLLEAPLLEALRRYASPAGRTVPVVPALLGSAAGVVGALRWARERAPVPPDPKGPRS